MPETVAQLTEAAQRSASVRDVEADLRRDLELVLAPFARDEVGLPDGAVRAEGTGRAGRFDAIYGGVIVEFKRPGLLGATGERSQAAQQGLSYLEDETLDARARAPYRISLRRTDSGVAEASEALRRVYGSSAGIPPFTDAVESTERPSVASETYADGCGGQPWATVLMPARDWRAVTRNRGESQRVAVYRRISLMG